MAAMESVETTLQQWGSQVTSNSKTNKQTTQSTHPLLLAKNLGGIQKAGLSSCKNQLGGGLAVSGNAVVISSHAQV